MNDKAKEFFKIRTLVEALSNAKKHEAEQSLIEMCSKINFLWGGCKLEFQNYLNDQFQSLSLQWDETWNILKSEGFLPFFLERKKILDLAWLLLELQYAHVDDAYAQANLQVNLMYSKAWNKLKGTKDEWRTQPPHSLAFIAAKLLRDSRQLEKPKGRKFHRATPKEFVSLEDGCWIHLGTRPCGQRGQMEDLWLIPWQKDNQHIELCEHCFSTKKKKENFLLLQRVLWRERNK